MYERRSKMDPLWNSLVIGGVYKGESFLATVDLYGTAYEDDIIATGYGGHLAIPLMREAIEAHGAEMTYEQAREVLENCMRVLYYRDGRAVNKVQFAALTEGNVEMNSAAEPVVLSTEWKYQKFVHPGLQF